MVEHTQADKCQTKEVQSLVRGLLETLDSDLKIPLVLRYFCDLDSRQIGELLEIPDSTVRSRLRAARQRLAAELTKAGYEHD
jgi:RNA polymerase sigma factor (sigma-70 family)